MNRSFLQENWSHMRGQIREWWDELTEEDVDLVNGDQEQLIQLLQDRYRYTEDFAREDVERHMFEYYPESFGE